MRVHLLAEEVQRRREHLGGRLVVPFGVRSVAVHRQELVHEPRARALPLRLALLRVRRASVLRGPLQRVTGHVEPRVHPVERVGEQGIGRHLGLRRPVRPLRGLVALAVREVDGLRVVL